MELPPLITATQTVNNARPNSAPLELTRLTGLPTDRFEALVTGVQPLSRGLQNQILTQLARLDVSRPMPAAELAQFTGAPHLRAITLQPAAHAPTQELEQALAKLIIVTPLAIRPEAKVVLQVRPDGQLQLANPGGTLQLTQPALSTSGQGLSTQEILASGLRQYLAYSRPLSESLNVLQRVSRVLQQLPAETQQRVLPVPVAQALTTALTQASAPAQMSARDLQARVASSGLFLENRLSPAIPEPQRRNDAGGANTAPPRLLTKDPAVPPDLKQQLLTLLAQTSVIPGATPQSGNRTEAVSPGLSETLSRAAATLRTSGILLEQLQQLAVKSTDPQTQNQLARQLAILIQTAAALGIARITGNQLQQLASKQRDPLASNQVHAELQVRVQEHFLPVNLFFEERKPVHHEEPETSDRKPRKTPRQHWRVFMELELPDGDHLASELVLHNEKLKTRLWAESPQLKQQANAHLQRLTKMLVDSGIVVEDVVLEPGPPPTAPLQPLQRLIDVET